MEFKKKLQKEDVYKRQGQFLSLKAFVVELTFELISPFIGVRYGKYSVFLVPVSYTHLDVYKRQVWNESR